ncbi:hypothetical protein PS467_08935 [Streptomyces luomodiensis]|uniref:Uncharacterized protein n=1 Tax=Streptomyces luomodiensis TaxID=3026192 RepID=A0ABY9USC9_9ACTN|nr:hypothetical protein [Streptomyces sp. SCA4-21]WNE95462.1 hypothetical protein PS467_08935 [Streptomyces sp. SCA4-21]
MSDSGDEVTELTGRFADWLTQDRSVGPHLTIDRVLGDGEGDTDGEAGAGDGDDS